MELPRIIIPLEAVSHPWDVNDSMPSFIFILSNVNFLSGIKRIWCGQEALRDLVVSKIVEELDGIQILGGFNHN